MLALVQDHQDSESLAMERRNHHRLRLQVKADATRLDHALPALRRPKLRFDVRDLSAGGLSAVSREPVMAGEQVAVQFPGKLGMPAQAAYGHVVRCEAGSRGYRVAVEFDPRPAA